MKALGKLRRPLLGGLIAVLAAVTILAAEFAARDFYRKINLMNSASSDNVQWVLSQAEVEFLELSEAAVIAARAPSPDLKHLRREFDIFYSRVATLRRGSLYADLAKVEDFDAALDQVRLFLEGGLPLIDGPDAAFIAALPAFEGDIRALRPVVRVLANSGLAYFAAESDARRRDVSVTLVWMAALTMALVAAFALLAYYFNSLNRQNLRRGRDLMQANARMNTILSTSLDGVVVTDDHGHVLEFNEAAEAIFLRRHADVIGKTIGELIVPAHLRDAHDAGMKRMRDGGPMRVVGAGRVRLEGVRANGEVFPVEMALQAARHDDAPIFISFLRDISARVLAEEQLTQARDRALAGEKAKADFLAVMSHEIRTPLNGLLGNLTLLRDTRLSARQEASVRNMDISGALLLDHVNTVLDITRFEAGKMQISALPVDLNKVLQDVVDGQSGAASANGTTIEWGWVGPPMRWALTDMGRLRQVLLNLVGNAVKFTSRGRIALELEALGPEGDARMVEFRVIDTGEGIPEEDLERVFEDFETRDASFGRITAGTGLGLGIARRIARAMDGEMGAESTVGEGSLFWLRLPLRAAEAPAAPTPDAPALARSAPLDILVVEDNEINRQVVREMLTAEGHGVTEAVDGRMGVATAETRRFDLILMDISMPVMDGLQAARAIRSGDGASRAAPIIALSATVMPEQTELFLEAGMNGFLGKPLSRAALNDVLADLPGGGRAPAARPWPERPLIDAAQHDETRSSLGPDAYPRLRDRFLAEGDDVVDRVDAMAESPEALGALCHKIGSSAAVFGAAAFRARLQQVERAAHDGTLVAGAVDLRTVWTPTRAALSDPEG